MPYFAAYNNVASENEKEQKQQRVIYTVKGQFCLSNPDLMSLYLLRVAFFHSLFFFIILLFLFSFLASTKVVNIATLLYFILFDFIFFFHFGSESGKETKKYKYRDIETENIEGRKYRVRHLTFFFSTSAYFVNGLVVVVLSFRQTNMLVYTLH